MSQTIRLTVSPELEKALRILRQSTSGTLNTTELIKMAVGEFAQIKKANLLDNVKDMTPRDIDFISSRSFYEWAKKDGTLNTNNIAHPEQMKPFTPKAHVRTR